MRTWGQLLSARFCEIHLDLYKNVWIQKSDYYWNKPPVRWKRKKCMQGGPEERNSPYSKFSELCSNQQLLSSLCWIEHLFPIIITSRSSNLVENFLFYETFLMDCHFRDLPDFQSFEARWQINGKSQKWQSIRNYS